MSNDKKDSESSYNSLSELLSTNKMLTSLSLRNLGITYEGLGKLKEGLKKNTSLVDIDMSENPKIGDKGGFELI